MGVIEPVGEWQQREILLETERYLDLAERLFGREFGRIPVLFDLSGSNAGMFRIARGRPVIRYNPWIFARHYSESMANTVPHEVAHYIVHELYDIRAVKPHGHEWRSVMRKFGANPEVTFDLDLEGVPRRRQRRHNYRCGCTQHLVSTTRHNRIRSGSARYRCRSCNGELAYDS